MKPINYPANFEATVIAALAHPCFIDSCGNLYALREDGATILVAGFNTGSNIQFQGVGSSRGITWAASQERLFVRFNEGAQSICATLPQVRNSQSIPEYRRSALAVASQSSVYLVHNTEDTLYCFAVSPDAMRLCAKVERHKGFGAWVENGNLYICGMCTRIHRDTKATIDTALLGFWFKHGIGTLLRIDLSSGRVHIESATDTKKSLITAWKADAGESDDRYVKPLLEAWLDCVETVQGRVLIGAIADNRPGGMDIIIEEPAPPDFDGIALYRYKGQKVELLRLLRGVHYVGKMACPEGELLYFVKREDQHDESKDRYFAMKVSPDMQSHLEPLTFDWTAEDQQTVRFEPSYDTRIGAIAVVITQVHDTYPHRQHFAMSDDGLIWRFVHQLPDQRT